MSNLLTFLSSILLFLVGAVVPVFFTEAAYVEEGATEVFESVEIGVTELSPNGEAGGYAIPASASSVSGSCTLAFTTPKNKGSNTSMTWSPNGTYTVKRSGTSLGTKSEPFAYGATLAQGSYTMNISKTVVTTVTNQCGSWGEYGCESWHNHNNTTNYSCSRTLTINDPTPTTSITHSPAAITLSGVSYNVSWISSNATAYSCKTNSRSRTYNGSAWSAYTGWSGNLSTAKNSNLNHAPSVAIITQYQYRETCTNTSSESNVKYVSHRIDPPPPPPPPVNGSCSATLNTCSVGTFVDQADSSSQYLWSCDGLSGGADASCSLDIPPTATISACDVGGAGCVGGAGTKNIATGDEVQINWSSTNAASCAFGGFDGVDADSDPTTGGDDDTVTEPAASASINYSVNCDGASANVTVSNTSIPSVSITSDGPSIVRSGEDVTIVWDINGNDESICSISGPGTAGTDFAATTDDITYEGGDTYSVTNMSTYTVSCGTESDSVTISVVPSLEET